MGAVADGLQAGEDAEGEKDEHQHHGKAHAPAEALQRRQGKAHAAAFQRQEVQRVAGKVAPLDLQVDALAVPCGPGHGLHGGPGLAEGLDHGQPPGVLDDRAGHVPVGLGLHRGVFSAVMGDEEQAPKGQRRRSQGDQGRHRAARRQSGEDHQEVQVSPDEIVDHPDAHVFQGGQAGGDGA